MQMALTVPEIDDYLEAAKGPSKPALRRRAGG